MRQPIIQSGTSLLIRTLLKGFNGASRRQVLVTTSAWMDHYKQPSNRHVRFDEQRNRLYSPSKLTHSTIIEHCLCYMEHGFRTDWLFDSIVANNLFVQNKNAASFSAERSDVSSLATSVER